MLIQALLLIFTGGVFVFRAEKKPEDFQTWISVISLIIGAFSVLAYLGAPPFDKSGWELRIGLLSLAGGLILIFAYRFELCFFPWLFSILMILHVLLYANAYWYIRHKAGFWWLTFPLFGFTLLLTYGLISGEPILGQYVLMLAGIQYVFCGIVTLFSVFVNRRLQIEFNKPISDFSLDNS